MPIFRRPIPPRRRRPPAPRRGLPGSPAARRALHMLREANALMAQGRAQEAGIIFTELAEKAAKRGLPRSGQLHLQAGRAWFDTGDTKRGMEHLRQGMNLMTTYGPAHRLPHIMQRVLHELRQRGFIEQASILETEFHALLKAQGLENLGGSKPPQLPLPPKCSYCGGSVYPDEIEWRNHQVAICAYCGSPLHANG